MITALLVAGCLQVAGPAPVGNADAGRLVYDQRCVWCHGPDGRGDGPAAAGLRPAPRDFTRGRFRLRSTAAGHLPTDADLFRTITRGIPTTAMPAWGDVLTETERWDLVAWLRTLSPRFAVEPRVPIAVPTGPASAAAGAEVFQRARCRLCHGRDGRGDGGIAVALDYEWGTAMHARDLTRGWSFKGGHDVADIFLRITGGLDGTPMGPYADLLTEQERWDLAQHVANLDEEPLATGGALTLTAVAVDGPLPSGPEAAAWRLAVPMTIPLAAQVLTHPANHWWTATAATATVRAVRHGGAIAFLLEWDDPTESRTGRPDSAWLQFAADPDTKPQLLQGHPGAPVTAWEWRAAPVPDGEPELAKVPAAGPAPRASDAADFTTSARWMRGRWQVVFRRRAGEQPAFGAGSVVPLAISIRDGANGEQGDRRALSTWCYVTTAPAGPWRPLLVGACWALAIWWLELALLRAVRR